MPGKKQHFIPQSLLRGFGHKQRKGYQVTVYSAEKGVFIANTDSVAAKRHFYSRPASDNETTLDDRITSYEAQLAFNLNEFRSIGLGQDVDPIKAAQTVVHLSIRNANIQESFEFAGHQIVEAAIQLFSHESTLRRRTGIDSPVPPGLLAEELEEMWGRVSPKLRHMGISKHDFLEFAFSAIKANFTELHRRDAPLIQQLMIELRDQMQTLVQQSHRGALLKTLAPLRRVERLTDLKWLVLPAPECGFVLPDCVVLASTMREDNLPMTYVGSEEISCVYFPIAHDRILVGSRKGTCDIPSRLNEFSATCSWSFFVARYQTPELAALRPRIRERIVAFIGRSVLEALSDSG